MVPNAQIEIQGQPERKRWFAIVEIGGLRARRREIVSPDEGLEAALDLVREVFYEMAPDLRPAELAETPGEEMAPKRRGRPPKAA